MLSCMTSFYDLLLNRRTLTWNLFVNFIIQELCFCSWMTKKSAYANEAKNVNKYPPINHFIIQELCFCSWIRKNSAYANEAKNVNKYPPINHFIIQSFVFVAELERRVRMLMRQKCKQISAYKPFHYSGALFW